MDVYGSLLQLDGVGAKTVEKLNKIHIYTILDLLLYFPREYEHLGANLNFDNINENDKQILSARVIKIKPDIRTRNFKIISTIEFVYDGHKVEGKWFNQPYIKKTYLIGNTYDLIGKFKKIGDKLEVINPEIVKNQKTSKETIIAKYPLASGVSGKLISKLVIQVLNKIKINDNIPSSIIQKFGLETLDFSINQIHFPASASYLRKAIERLKFQELFTYSMKLLILKKSIQSKKNGNSIEWDNQKLIKLKDSIPYKLTEAQNKVIRQILIDQKSKKPMNRLIQGDVGSGKTIVALIAIFNAYTNGYKSALMVPTEILALQHYSEAKKLFEPFGVEIELLIGSTSAKEKKRIKERIKEEQPVVVIGTHAIIQDDVEFEKLGLVVTDEQHRFGVEQRSRLINKGSRADTLVMSATPIPRTLALFLYSDLDVSVIDQLPPGRKKVLTEYFDGKQRDKAYRKAAEQVHDGRQVYIVCPLIEEDEEDKLKSVLCVYNDSCSNAFKNCKTAILHGKMKPSEKEQIISDFKDKKIDILISTTVIEVGVNVPNASVMIIEDAQRFGLAQLHQLRGRVGRGKYESYCFLIASAKSDATKKRMKIMESSNDGFYIADQDLKIRGSGELFGTRQSGGEGLILADMYQDIDILKTAIEEAKVILDLNDKNSQELVESIKLSLEKSKNYICFN